VGRPAGRPGAEFKELNLQPVQIESVRQSASVERGRMMPGILECVDERGNFSAEEVEHFQRVECCSMVSRELK